MAHTTLLVGLLFGAGRKQDGRTRAHLQRAYYNQDGTYNRASMPGIGKPSLTFIILIIAALAFAAYFRVGSVVSEPVG
jgi:hypothetical protein